MSDERDFPPFDRQPDFINPNTETKFWIDHETMQYIRSKALNGVVAWCVEERDGHRTRLLTKDNEYVFENPRLEDIAVHIDIMAAATLPVPIKQATRLDCPPTKLTNLGRGLAILQKYETEFQHFMFQIDETVGDGPTLYIFDGEHVERRDFQLADVEALSQLGFTFNYEIKGWQFRLGMI